MTERQEKFCLEYIRCGNATQAYKAAGYKSQSEKAATANAARMITYDSIQVRLNELREQVKGPKIMDAQERRQKLTEIATSRYVKPDVAIKAIDVLNKMDCLYVQKTELSGTVQTVPDRLVIDYGDGGDGEED